MTIRRRSLSRQAKDVAFELDYNRVNAPTVAPDALEKAIGRFESHAVRDQSMSQIYSRTDNVVLLKDERATTYDLSRIVSFR